MRVHMFDISLDAFYGLQGHVGLPLLCDVGGLGDRDAAAVHITKISIPRSMSISEDATTF